MATYDWSEVFMSIEGEGPYTGHPTAYIRFTKCNFTCQKFNNPENLEITNEVLGFDPKDYDDIKKIPIITKGCDSIYSWDNRFKHLWKKGNEEDLAKEVISILPHKKWINPTSGRSVILSLTGGEPTLRWKTIPTLIEHPLMSDMRHILIETNCSVTLPADFIRDLSAWLYVSPFRLVTWSNSPKLPSISGEQWKDAIRPDVAVRQNTLGMQSEQYFKFVCDDSDAAFNEVFAAMTEYHNAGVPLNTPVYIMPMACTEEQQEDIAARVAQKCIEYGYIYCHRVQNSVFGNGVGT